jgi:hypothetical protein
MTKKLTDIENRIEALQSEESAIENRKTHQGFRDASRRNRIEEKLDVLHETLRREQSPVPDAQHLGDGQHEGSSTT